MVIINNSEKAYNDFDLSHYAESLDGYQSGMDVITKRRYESLDAIDLGPNQAYIVELER